MADAFEDVPDGGLVVLKVDIEKIPHEKTAGYELTVLDDIPVERITDILEETLKPSAQLVSRLRMAKEIQSQKIN